MRKRKKAALILVVVLIVFGAGIFVGYQLLFNHIDPEEETAINTEVDAITESILDDIEEAEAEGETTISGEGESVIEPGTTEVEGQNEEAPVVSEKDRILSLYSAGFEKLQTEGNAIIDRLVAGIKTDYEALLAEGAGKTAYAQLAASYTNRANAYEKGVDSSVDALLSAMKEDLAEAGVAESEIAACVADYEAEYEAQKAPRQEKIFARAKEFL